MAKKFKSFSNNRLDSKHLHVFRNLFLLVIEQNSINTIIIDKTCLYSQLPWELEIVILIAKCLDRSFH